MNRLQCSRCGNVAYGKGIPHVCAGCAADDFPIDLGPIDWRLFQVQRATLLSLIEDDRLSEMEHEHLKGIIAFTDHIIDVANEHEIDVPSLDEIVLDRLAEI